ncbi:MAG: hypothetical protein J4O03_05430 [Chloroflexi bacterium]|nr:hypothetical protein [Chloroflexota bacterium]MCI0792892.1 hypothetical protein [Chloroflexota bacterium]MCI0823156.1 hypothetical protein [Chloroflexota bacterium]MCI0878490.1 hypothetical protein [Chloroflexota bacterium]
MDPSTGVEVASLEEAHEAMFELGWTDGLPAIPPTAALVEAALDYLGRDPQEVIGEVPPKNRIATVEKVVVNCVMAGCKPEYIPVVIAAVEAMLDDSFNLNGVQATTNCISPLAIVSGPVVDQLGFNPGDNVFGGGSRANATVGRAVRLVLWNIGGGYAGEIDRATLGHPGKFSYCIAENSADSPWGPIHQDQGFSDKASCVTVFACEAPHHIATGSGYVLTANDILSVIADSIATAGSATMNGGGQVLLVLGPMTAQKLANDGYDKGQIRTEIKELAHKPVKLMRSNKFLNPEHPFHWAHLVDPSDDDAMIPALRNADDLLVMVAGGWGSGSGFNAICHGWMQAGGLAQTREIVMPEKSD